MRLRDAEKKGVWRTPVSGATTFVRAQQRFGSELAARQYPARYPRSLKGLMERWAILSLLDQLKPGSHILDCPCGTGRVMQLLLAKRFRVTAADCSPHMVEQCREVMLAKFPNLASRMIFGVEDVALTSYASRQFDAVVCNRLLHHYAEPETRIAVLRELARVSSGPIIVSFKDTQSVSSLRRRLKAWLTGHPSGSNAVTRRQMQSEFEAAGIRPTNTKPVMWGVSRMCYMVGLPRGPDQNSSYNVL